MDLEGIEGNDTKQGQIMIGEEGTKVAKNISRRIEAAIEKGNFSLNVSGSVFVTNRKSMNISEPKRYCKKGQTYRDGYCRKYFLVSICLLHLFAISSINEQLNSVMPFNILL